MRIADKHRVDADTLKIYEGIDGLKVIEDYLLFKGTDNYVHRTIALSKLEKMAHITYALKVNPTNKLYVGTHLERYYRRADLFTSKGIRIPEDIFQRVAALYNGFKSKQNTFNS